MKEQGEDVPEPLSERRYSGKFNLRLGEKLHREVALHAAEENLSVNQWVVRRLMVDDWGSTTGSLSTAKALTDVLLVASGEDRLGTRRELVSSGGLRWCG